MDGSSVKGVQGHRNTWEKDAREGFQEEGSYGQRLKTSQQNTGRGSGLQSAAQTGHHEASRTRDDFRVTRGEEE